jgi:soluble lytic murein transglycosylase
MFKKLRTLSIVLLTFTALSVPRLWAVESSSTAHRTTTSKKKSAALQTNAHKKTGHRRGPAALRVSARKKVAPAKLRRMARAFVGSADLKLMARQLVENRTPAAYSGVEAYAHRHANSDAGALAWLAVGYSRVVDEQYAQAIEALEKAKPNAGELYDYVQYLEAISYAGEGNSAKVVELLHDFDVKAPESIFQNDVVGIYGSALAALGRTQEAIAYLEEHRLPVRASIELALGKSYLHSEHPEKGMEILKHLYFTMPASTESVEAAAQLTAAGSGLEGSYAEQTTRAELLAKAGRWGDAERAYRDLQSTAPATEQGNVAVALAAVMRHTNAAAGRTLLEEAQARGEANAQRLYLLGEIARGENNDSAVAANLARMRQEASTSQWFEQALLSAANLYLLEKNFDRAIVCFGEMQQRFHRSPRASYANWKAAWLTYRQGRRDEAKQEFENQVAWYPDRPEIPAALYWRARIAEDEHDYAMARAWYTKLGARFRNYYYGYLGRERLAALPLSASPAPAVVAVTAPGKVAPDKAASENASPDNAALEKVAVSKVGLTQDAVLAQIPELKAPGPEALEVEAPANQLRAEKSRLLANAGLCEFAIRELQAEQGGQGARWATLQIARIYQDIGQNHRAIQFLKKALPGYYSVDLADLPRPYWEILFPRPYWTEVRRQAMENSLNPYLVASLIRQESEFNPGAVSHANAYGLMQLLPQVGKGEARAAHIQHFSIASLLAPEVNIQLGTHYFKEMVTQYNGQVEYALAAYNAGSNRVDDWRQSGHYGDVAEFVESIPFTETREYVQAIMRNAKVYQRLYPQP